jgi:hypothetical protein
MQALGNQLLAGPALADHQHWAVERSGTARPLDSVEKSEALADELFCAFHARSKIRPTVGGKSHQLARIFTLLDSEKWANSLNLDDSGILARLLYSKGQV